MKETIVHSLFLELLKSAIWNKPADYTKFQHIDGHTWQSIFKYSLTQASAALITDAISSLPEEYMPPRSVLIDCMVVSQKIEDANYHLDNVLKTLVRDYESLNLPFILLKGQTNAIYYPNPSHRSSGDIDLYFYREGDYYKVKKWISDNGYECEEETLYHQAYYYENELIEAHNTIIYFSNEKYIKILESKVDEIIRDDSFQTIQINGVSVKVFPVEFNTFYVFGHLFHHFVHTGIGFRQICDWLLILKNRHSDIDNNRFTALAKQFDLLNPMRVFAHACIKYLDASPEIFPFDIGNDTPYSDLVMDDVLKGGNFGNYRPEVNGQLSKKLNERWHRYKITVKRVSTFRKMSPEHIGTLPIKKLIVFVKDKMMKRDRS